jgi:hypothetical protein
MSRRTRPGSDVGARLREYFTRLEMAICCTPLGVDWSPAANGRGCLLDQLHAPDQVPLPELTPEQLSRHSPAVCARWPQGSRTVAVAASYLTGALSVSQATSMTSSWSAPTMCCGASTKRPATQEHTPRRRSPKT